MNIESGSLRDFSLPDIFQIASMGKRSGRLDIQSLRWKGHVRFQDGQVVDAAFGDWRGEDAVYLLFTCGEGEFQFQGEDAAAEQQAGAEFKSTADLIAGGLRRGEAWKALQQQHEGLQLTSWVELGPTPPPAGLDPDAERIVKHLEAVGTCAHGVMVADLIHGLGLTEKRVGNLLVELAEQGVVRLVNPEEQGVQHLFNTITHTLFEKFAAISGWRMVDGFVEALRQELAAAADPPLSMRYEQQELTIEWLTQTLNSSQVAICRRLLDLQIEAVGKAHGTDFVQRLLGDIYRSQTASQQHLWQDLNLPLPQPQPSETVS